LRFGRLARTVTSCLALLLAACVGLFAAAAPAPAASVVTKYPLTTNVRLITTRFPTKPVEERTLKVTPTSASVPDIVPAAASYPMFDLTSTMGANAGALAAINGDFGTSKDQPTHILMIDGELWTTGDVRGDAIAWNETGTTFTVGAPALRIGVTSGKGTPLFTVHDWNAHAPTRSSISAYTARGGSVTVPPGKASPTSTDPYYCEAQLDPSSGPRWTTGRTAIVRRYTVVAQPEPCPQTKLLVGSTAGEVVLASRTTKGVSSGVGALRVGQTVKISTRFNGWPGVTDVMGAGVMLVDGGKNVAPPYTTGDPYIFDFNPRTAAGLTKGCSDTDPTTACRLVLITIDGRQKSTGWSVGARLPFLADQLIKAGAYTAVNLDGGGSTSMWVQNTSASYCQSYPTVGGCLVMRPSQSFGERGTRSAIVVLPTADTGAPKPLR
jgi:exopolysaccharide biosynthesis protein